MFMVIESWLILIWSLADSIEMFACACSRVLYPSMLCCILLGSRVSLPFYPAAIIRLA